jgi:hypothetical protein
VTQTLSAIQDRLEAIKTTQRIGATTKACDVSDDKQEVEAIEAPKRELLNH